MSKQVTPWDGWYEDADSRVPTHNFYVRGDLCGSVVHVASHTYTASCYMENGDITFAYDRFSSFPEAKAFVMSYFRDPMDGQIDRRPY